MENIPENDGGTSTPKVFFIPSPSANGALSAPTSLMIDCSLTLDFVCNSAMFAMDGEASTMTTTRESPLAQLANRSTARTQLFTAVDISAPPDPRQQPRPQPSADGA